MADSCGRLGLLLAGAALLVGLAPGVTAQQARKLHGGPEDLEENWDEWRKDYYKELAQLPGAKEQRADEPPWMDDDFIDREAAAKEAHAQLRSEADELHDEAIQAAVAATAARLKADEANRSLYADFQDVEAIDKKWHEKHGWHHNHTQSEVYGRKNEPLQPPNLFDPVSATTPSPDGDASSSPTGSSCDPSKGEECGGARRLSKAPPPSVTLLTLSSDSDWLPIELMLPHQVAQSTQGGRERLERVLVLKMPASPHHKPLDPAEIPFGMVPLTASGDQNGADEVIQLDVEGLTDSGLFKQFLTDDGVHSAQTVKDLWTAGVMTAPEDANADDSVFHQSTMTLGLLSAMRHCNTTYCAFMEPDVFVHRHPNQKGWIDRGVELMEADPNLVVVQAAKMSNSETEGSCSTSQSPDGLFSQRYFLLHRKRLDQYLPVEVDCAPRCDTFEAFFRLPTVSVGHMSCSSTASWVIHPPESEDATMNLIGQCVVASGREEELTGKTYNKPGHRRLARDPSKTALPALGHEVWEDQHTLNVHRRLAASSWVGLPDFLDHISSSHDFGGAATISGGEQIRDELHGWTCPSKVNV